VQVFVLHFIAKKLLVPRNQDPEGGLVDPAEGLKRGYKMRGLKI